MHTGWRIARDPQADALYIYTFPPEVPRPDEPAPAVAYTRQLAAGPAEVLADFSADHRLVGVEILHHRRLRPLYRYRRHRPDPGAPSRPR